ncbi:MAG: hypothetical protein MI757_08935 [Pirellulales bacterium]|nr:hypothetical protein [Pirellulales bacterium]
METAVSIPDDVFNAAEDAAAALSLNRSEFYTQAVRAYLSKMRDGDITANLNEVYKDEPSSLDPILAKMQSMSIEPEEW